jgi:DNA-3-methyladenine glycosylase
MSRLPRGFYEGFTPKVARELLGKVLVRIDAGRRLSGVIVETEAYRGLLDPASHAFRGRTPRNEMMFGKPGRAYVYFVYGFHYCLNVVTEPEGTPAAVLIRAVQPLDGVAEMRRNRAMSQLNLLANGPGKLTKAMNIGRELNGEDLVTSERLYVEEGPSPGFSVGAGPRIGLTRGAERRWRFFVKGSPFTSRRD